MKISKRVKILFISISAPLLFVVAFILVVAAYSHFHTSPEVDVMTVRLCAANHRNIRRHNDSLCEPIIGDYPNSLPGQ